MKRGFQPFLLIFWCFLAPVKAQTQIDWFSAQDATNLAANGVSAMDASFRFELGVFTGTFVPTYTQWQTDELDGETLIQPDEDADGTANILEFVFGTAPKTANPSPIAPAALTNQYLHLTVPRRADRPATLVVEVSEDLSQWNSGAGHTATVLSSTTSLTVRDLIPISPTAPKRFIRLKATP
ncbi:MAG: hypothetical protein IZT59_12880 [Verrucomicrobia bacterium]|jgi:hypothetical protein|nr:hypothetical protein [Verrucomicrobiota bacterium]|tara:strand:+ start:2843 stop:3388 length:546 start_codon:yes stop_codon:yes gene_type:complete